MYISVRWIKINAADPVAAKEAGYSFKHNRTEGPPLQTTLWINNIDETTKKQKIKNILNQ